MSSHIVHMVLKPFSHQSTTSSSASNSFAKWLNLRGYKVGSLHLYNTTQCAVHRFHTSLHTLGNIFSRMRIRFLELRVAAQQFLRRCEIRDSFHLWNSQTVPFLPTTYPRRLKNIFKSLLLKCIYLKSSFFWKPRHNSSQEYHSFGFFFQISQYFWWLWWCEKNHDF